ncbi:MAG: Crp/Fnr family transcriptional regulator [Bryobacteraceae bacterium]|nr:Crp/Fnr family transcriptional regulator [Bryobacteraceae bacterium]
MLLASLDPATQRDIARMSSPRHFETGAELIADGRAISNVYFPLDLVASLLVPLPGRRDIEAAIVGDEGLIGASLLLGMGSTVGRTVVQVGGSALQMRASAFMELSQRHHSIPRAVRRYLFTLISQTVRTAACNQVHSMEQRCARWILQCQDRAGRSTFPMSHRQLASLMGVRRATMTEALGRLRQQGLVEYSRGLLSVSSRETLETAVCGCYEGIRRDYQAALPIRAGGGTEPYPTVDLSSPEWHDPDVRVVVYLTSDSEDIGFLSTALRSVDCSLQMAAVKTLPQALALASLGPAVLVCGSDIPADDLKELFSVPAFQRIPFVQLSGDLTSSSAILAQATQPGAETQSSTKIGRLISTLAGAA